MGDPIPESIRNAPVLDDLYYLYWFSFWDLNSCRNLSMGYCPIPWTAIREYAEFHNIDDFEEFKEIIMKFDERFYEIIREKDKK